MALAHQRTHSDQIAGLQRCRRIERAAIFCHHVAGAAEGALLHAPARTLEHGRIGITQGGHAQHTRGCLAFLAATIVFAIDEPAHDARLHDHHHRIGRHRDLAQGKAATIDQQRMAARGRRRGDLVEIPAAHADEVAFGALGKQGKAHRVPALADRLEDRPGNRHFERCR